MPQFIGSVPAEGSLLIRRVILACRGGIRKNSEILSTTSIEVVGREGTGNCREATFVMVIGGPFFYLCVLEDGH